LRKATLGDHFAQSGFAGLGAECQTDLLVA
jgi:hypothetical protein